MFKLKLKIVSSRLCGDKGYISKKLREKIKTLNIP